MLRPVGLAARPSGSSPGSCSWSPRAWRSWDSIRPKISSAIATMLVRAMMRSSLCRKIGRTLVLVVAVAALDELLILVEAQHARGAQASGEVGRERVDAVGARGGGDRVVVAGEAQRGAAGARGGRDADQARDGAGEDLRDAGVDLAAGLVVAAAEPALDARQGVLGLGQRALGRRRPRAPARRSGCRRRAARAARRSRGR